MKTIGRILMLGVGFFASAACSLFPARKPALPRGFPLPLQVEIRLEIDGELTGSLQAWAGKIYFSTRKGILYAVDAGSKKILWKTETNLPLVSPPSVGFDRIVFSDQNNGIHCLNLDGKELWAKTAPAKLSADIILDSGRIYAVVDGTDILALNAVDGAEAWRFKAGSAIRTPPMIWNLQVVFAASDGKIHVLDPQGRLRTSLETGSAAEGPLFVEKNRLYFGQAEGVYRCLDLASHKTLWTVKTGGLPTSRPAVDGRRIYVVTSNDVLFCFDKMNGNLEWWRILSARSPFSPAVGDDQVFAASSSSVLTILKKTTGVQAGIFNAGEQLRASPLLIGGNLVVPASAPDAVLGGLLFLKGTPPPEPAKKK